MQFIGCDQPLQYSYWPELKCNWLSLVWIMEMTIIIRHARMHKLHLSGPTVHSLCCDPAITYTPTILLLRIFLLKLRLVTYLNLTQCWRPKIDNARNIIYLQKYKTKSQIKFGNILFSLIMQSPITFPLFGESYIRRLESKIHFLYPLRLSVVGELAMLL